MYRHSKPATFLIPAAVSLLSLVISTSVLAERRLPKGAVVEQDSSVSTEDNGKDKDNRPNRGQRGDQQAPQPAVIAPQPGQGAQIPNPRLREQREQRNNAQPEIVRQDGARQGFRGNQQDRNIILEREDSAQRLAAQREREAANARNREAQNARPNFSGKPRTDVRVPDGRDNNRGGNDDRNDRGPGNNNDRDNRGPGNNNDRDGRNDRDDRNGRNDRDNDNRGGPNNGRGPQLNQRQWQEQQQRQANDYRRNQNNQFSDSRRLYERLRQQNRNEQYRSQQRYYERLNQQRRNYNNNRYSFNVNYYNSPNIYRYSRGGSYYYANRYQADLMRQAINYGYEEGFYAGRADRSDRWGYNYRDAYAYQDANYGYYGYYVDQGTYNYYFREGFRRGYDDGFYSRYQYGRRYGNGYSANDSILRLILNLTNWHN